MGDGLLVFRLCKRVDGPDLLAPARQPLEPARQRLALLGVELGGGRLRFELQPAREHLKLLGGLLEPVPDSLELDLALGQTLVALAQLRVQRGFLLGALLELRRHVLSGLPIGAERELELLASPGDRARHMLERDDHAADARQQRLVARVRGVQPLDPRLPLGALALLALSRAAGRRQLGGHLHATTRVGAVVGRRAPALDRGRDPPLLLARLVAAGDRGAVRGDRVLGLGVGARHRLAVTLERRPRRELGLRRRLAGSDQRVAAVALGQHALLAHRRRLAQLAGPGRPDPSGERDRDPVEPAGQPLEALDHPHVAQQRSRKRRRVSRPVDVSGERLGSVLRRWLGDCVRLRRAIGRRDQRAAAIGAGAIEQRGGGGQIAQHRGAQPAVERGRDRELVAGIDLELIGEHGGPARGGGLAAQELVAGGELAAHPRGLTARRLYRPLGLAQLAARLLEPLARLLAGDPGLLDGRGPLADRDAGGAALVFELGQLARELGLAVAFEAGQLLLELGDPRVGLGVRRVGLGGRPQPFEQLASAAKTALDVPLRRPHRLGPVGNALAGGLRQEAASRELLAMGAAVRQRLLGCLAASGDGRELALDLLAMGARLGGGLLGGGELGLVPAQIVPAEFPSRLERLAFETGVELGGLRLALERSQARAGLALDV